MSSGMISLPVEDSGGGGGGGAPSGAATGALTGSYPNPGVNLSSLQVSGVTKVANGGTGLNTIGAPLQILRVNAAGTALEFAPNDAANSSNSWFPEGYA